MNRKLLVVCLSFSALVMVSCNRPDGPREPPRPIARAQAPQVHGAGPSLQNVKVGTAEVLKSKKLADYDTQTIGEAFEKYRYFDSKEWKETRTGTGKVYIDFIGFKAVAVTDMSADNKGAKSRGLNVKFVINPDGKFYVAMVSRLAIMTDGKLYEYPLEDKKRILDAIYSGNEINP